MKSKVEFYNAFFKTLNEKGFTVEEPSSPDYLVDIRHRGKIIAFYTKGDVIMKNPFEEAQDKLLERIEQLALATADVCGICADQPYEEEKVQKLANGVVKINEHDNVILACKHHPLLAMSCRLTARTRSTITCRYRDSIFIAKRRRLRALLPEAALSMRRSYLPKVN